MESEKTLHIQKNRAAVNTRIKGLILACFLFAEWANAACPERFAIAPPPVNDRPLASWLSAEVTTFFAEPDASLRCRTILGLDQTAAIFDMVGVTTGFPLAPRAYQKNQISFIATELNATHILFLESPSESGLLRLKLFRIRDQERLIPVRHYTLQLDEEELAARRSRWISRQLSKLAPNTVTFGFSDTDVYFNVDEKVFGEKTQTTRGLLPPLLSSITLARVDHRRGYRLFDVAGSILPATYFFGINQDNHYTRNPGLPDADQYPEELSMHIETYGAAGSVNAQGSLFSPVGTSYLGIGWGPALFWLQKQDRRAGWYLTAATRLFFGHRIFVSDHLFVAFDWDSLLFHQNLYKTKYAKAYQVERGSFTLGWYLEDSEALASTMWDSIF